MSYKDSSLSIKQSSNTILKDGLADMSIDSTQWIVLFKKLLVSSRDRQTETYKCVLMYSTSR